MLDGFIQTNREAIIARTRARVAARQSPRPAELELTSGIPLFLDQLTLQLGLARERGDGGNVDHDSLVEAAQHRGGDLLRLGLTVGQVVHDYGHVCQAITELAAETHAPISSDEFRTLNLCLDDAIAGAVAEYSRLRERSLADADAERLGVLAHELRNRLNTAVLAFESIKSGQVAINGSTGAILGRSLMGLRDLIDRSLMEVRIAEGLQTKELISVADLLEEIEIGAEMQAKALGIRLDFNVVGRDVIIEGDRQTILGVLANLLQNALKFTHPKSSVSLRTNATEGKVLFEVEDECGGLPAGKADDLFQPFSQRGKDRSGVGLGLAISRKGAKANGGEILIRDLPGKGCIFALELPRKTVTVTA